MTKIDERRCDVCDDRIGRDDHARLSRGLLGRFRLRLFRWGIIDINPVDSGWIPTRADVCGDCWDDVLAEVGRRIRGDHGD